MSLEHSSNMIENQNFHIVKDTVITDEKGRLNLGTVAKAKSYRVLINDAGQILLDPVVNIPERELWIWENSVARTSLEVGVKQASSGELHDLGSFTQYADLEIDE
ncbi:hypothetical protein [Nostoc sp. FACHB-892]|uniref:hypothetical protein n=1 Tax=Nostoc sp. FACHB-892 TaxID=2692843 RepID=UPI001F557928|nr:hypothetical protein [Nostoc sp. FACHB-892]